MVSTVGKSLDSGNVGEISFSYSISLPAALKASKHISKINDVFSAISQSFMVEK